MRITIMRNINVLTLWVACAVIVSAGFVGVAAAEPEEGAPPAAKWEHFAFACGLDYLDGPRLEAFGAQNGRKMANDVDGNWFIVWKYSTSWLRSIRVDGRMETICGDDRWGSSLDIDEGPAAFFPNMHEYSLAGDQSNLFIGIAVYGAPLKGEDHGAIYVYFMVGPPYKVFKNKDKEDRWWFKRLGAAGKATPPTTIGESALVSEVNLDRARIGQGWITWTGHLYAFDEAKQTITCLLNPAFYVPRAVAEMAKIGKTLKKGSFRTADRMVLAEDGTMYLMHPWREGNVFRISADRSTFEYIVQHNREIRAGNIDGPGLNTTWHCGPSYLQPAGGVLFLRAIDSPSTRRWQDGRVSVLCMDGEWREHVSKTDKRKLNSPGGMGYRAADHGLPYIYIHYPGSGLGTGSRVFKFGPVDFTKPTVGLLAKDSGEQE